MLTGGKFFALHRPFLLTVSLVTLFSCRKDKTTVITIIVSLNDNSYYIYILLFQIAGITVTYFVVMVQMINA